MLHGASMKHIALKITAFIFGIALWLYVVSLNTFKVELDIPVRLVKLPEMLAIASKPPHTMRITLEGAPFDLMRLRSKVMQGDTTAAAIIVDLQDAELGAVINVYIMSCSFCGCFTIRS